jgi:hypothetical protein
MFDWDEPLPDWACRKPKKVSGRLLTPSPPAEKATASQRKLKRPDRVHVLDLGDLDIRFHSVQ